jgi:putative transposase
LVDQSLMVPHQEQFGRVKIQVQCDCMAKRRHSTLEIDAKLRQGDAMHRQGISKIRIAEALGISPMTYHRWLAAREVSGATIADATVANPEIVYASGGHDLTSRIRELELENARLRRLLTDTMLEKAALQESARKLS